MSSKFLWTLASAIAMTRHFFATESTNKTFHSNWAPFDSNLFAKVNKHFSDCSLASSLWFKTNYIQYFRTKLIFASTPQIMHQNISEISLIVLVPENPGFDPSFCHKMIRNCSVLSPSLALKQCYALGGSPGLVFFFSFWFSGYGWWLMFERLWVRIMAPYTGWTLRHCFTFICCKNWNVCLKRPKINENEAGVGQILKKQCYALLFTYLTLKLQSQPATNHIIALVRLLRRNN